MTLPPAWKIKRELVRPFKRLIVPIQYPLDLTRQSLHDVRSSQRVKVTQTERPLGDRIAIFVIFQPNGIAASTFFTMDHLVEQGFDVVVVCNGPHRSADILRLAQTATLIVERPNLGYDFGGYRDGLRVVNARAKKPRRLVFLNDSTWFPLRLGDDTLSRMDQVCKIMIGHIFKTEDEKKPANDHVESHLLMFSGEGVASPAFKEFWANLVLSNRRDATIARGEKQITQAILKQESEAKGLLSHEAVTALLSNMDSAEIKAVMNCVIPYDQGTRVLFEKLNEQWDKEPGASLAFQAWVHQALSNSSQYLLSAAFVNFAMRYGKLGFAKKADEIRFHLARQEVLRMEKAGLIPPLHPAVRSEMLAMVERWPSGPSPDNTAASRASRPD